MAVETTPAPAHGKLYQGVEKDAFGYRMMSAMGWAEGKGLGAKENGITKHVAVKKRVDLTGIGADWKADDSAKVNWCANTHNFEAVLANLQVEYGDGASAEEGKKKKKSKKKKGKKAAESSAESEGKAAAAAAESSSSEEEEAAKRPQEAARGRPQGRYKKREMGKLVKGYSATDLNQILGVVPGTEDPFAAAAAAAFGASRGASDDDKEEDEDKEDRPQAKKAKTEKKEKAKKEKRKSKGKAQGSDEEAEEEEAGRTARAVSEKGATVSADRTPPAAAESEDDEAAEADGPQVDPPAAGWWGEKLFHWAGILGQIRREKKRGRGFDEDEQERVYTEAHELKMQNRQGLGQKDRPKKVAGARWAGKKVTFGEGGDGDSDEQEEEEDGSKAAKPAPSGPSGERGGSEKATGGGPGPKSPDKVKWKKLSEAALTGAGGSMKLSALQKAVLAAAGVPHGEQAAGGAFLDALMRRLQKSSRFDVGAKKVKLVAGAEGGDDE